MKTAVVTGAAKPESIGHEVAVRLQKEGMQVVVLDLYEEGFSSLPGCRCIRCDVSDPSAIESAFASLKELHVLVNCVGGSWEITKDDLRAGPRRGFRGLTNCSLDDWNTIRGANLDSVFYCCRAAAPLLRKQGGAVVNVSSVAARKGIPPGAEGSSGPYAVAKAGVMGLTRQLALELGSAGVRVNCVAPGVIASGRLKKVQAVTAKGAGPEGPLKQIPMGRVGTVAETAALIVALCSDDTAYLTGVTIDVNGASYAA
ncbi:MAG: 2-hydroxycyclohexanecarboxyl-CoA dehydrogenase [Betaproteobacteria bacterium]|nr:2-hydroxycyclohexanecarboxyl-CoA dehydrogenase [Betaproteobacteria bacterium]